MSVDALSEKIRNAIEEALRKGKKRRFKESVEMIIAFDSRMIDPRKSEFRIRETVFLPHKPKKDVKICVVATGDLALQAKESGAYKVIGRDELNEMSSDKKKAKKFAKECDWTLIQTDLMPIAGRVIGPALGPRGKIPVPLPPRADVKSVIENYKRAVLVRIKDQPQIQVRIGTIDNSIDELVENAQAILQVVENKFKNLNCISAIYFKKTMGEPVKVTIK